MKYQLFTLTGPDGEKFHGYGYITDDPIYKRYYDKRVGRSVELTQWLDKIGLPQIELWPVPLTAKEAAAFCSSLERLTMAAGGKLVEPVIAQKDAISGKFLPKTHPQE